MPQNNNTNRFRGSVAAGYSILARTYLYMGSYSKAAQNAQLALDNGPNTVLDYTTLANSGAIPILFIRPDAIYSRLSTSNNYSYSPTLGFLKTFDTKDLRLQLYYKKFR